MVEVVLSLLLISLVLLVSLNAVGASFQTVKLTAEKEEAHLLASDLLAEIMAQPYQDPDDTAAVVLGREANEIASPSTRSEFDDVDDYHLWTESPPAQRDGTPFSEFSGWTRSVMVERPLGTVISDAHPSQITVTATDPDGDTTTLTAIRSRGGAVEQPTGITTEFVTSLTVELTTPNTTTIRQGINLLNHANSP